MSDLTVNGVPVLRGDLLLPRVGQWSADLVLDAETAPSGSVAIESPMGLRLVGTVERASSVEGRVEVRIQAGTNGLGRQLEPVAYRPVGGVRVRTILEDWARACGETLSQSMAPELLATFVTAWVRERGSAARAIRSLALELGCSWRFDAEGGLLLVRETWPTVDPDGVQVLRDDPVNDAVELAVDVPLPELVPGVTWQGRRVSAVEAFIVGNGHHRVRLLFENELVTTARDRSAIKYNLAQREEIDTLPYHGVYLARVVTQSADLSTVDVELEPDVDPALRRMPGLVRVPLYGGTPQRLRVEADRKMFCLVTFLSGDRAKPCVVGWLSNGPQAGRIDVMSDEVRLGMPGNGTRKVARDADPVSASETFAAWVSSVSTIAGVPAPTGPIGEIADGSPTVKTD